MSSYPFLVEQIYERSITRDEYSGEYLSGNPTESLTQRRNVSLANANDVSY